MNATSTVISDMKKVMGRELPLDHILDEQGNAVYYDDLSDDYERTAYLHQSLLRCFRDAIDELRSYYREEEVFDLIAERDLLSAGLDAEKGHWEMMTDEILSFEEDLNKLCKEERDLLREIEQEEKCRFLMRPLLILN